MKWLNGKKTVLGAGFMLASVLIRWVSDGETPDVAAISEAVGAVLAGIGLAHKGAKFGIKNY